MDIAHITPYLLIDTPTWSMIKEKKGPWKLETKVGQKAISDVNYERAKKDKLERDLKAWKNLGTYNKQ